MALSEEAMVVNGIINLDTKKGKNKVSPSRCHPQGAIDENHRLRPRRHLYPESSVRAPDCINLRLFFTRKAVYNACMDNAADFAQEVKRNFPSPKKADLNRLL
jgi:hypothetical protein